MHPPKEFETVIGDFHSLRGRLYYWEKCKFGYDISYIAKIVLDTFIIHDLKRLHKAQDNNTDEATQVRKEIAELKDKKHRLSKLLTKHFIEPEQYSAQVYEIDGQIRMLNRKLEKSPEKKDPITLRLEELAEIFEKYDGSEKAQAVVMETAVHKIIVCEDGTIHFQLLDSLEFVERIETYEGH